MVDGKPKCLKKIKKQIIPRKIKGYDCARQCLCAASTDRPDIFLFSSQLMWKVIQVLIRVDSNLVPEVFFRREETTQEREKSFFFTSLSSLLAASQLFS